MTAASIPGVELDFDHGMIRLGDQRFPACIELWHRDWLTNCEGVCAECIPFENACPSGGHTKTVDVAWAQE
jgi:hypothetical protein